MLRTPPPHISSSEEILPRLTLAKLRTNQSPFLKSYLHKVDAKSPLCLLCNTHTHTSSLQLHPHCHPCICGQTPLEGLHCWPYGRRRCWLVNHKREHRNPTPPPPPPPPLARVIGVVRQQHLTVPPLVGYFLLTRLFRPVNHRLGVSNLSPGGVLNLIIIVFNQQKCPWYFFLQNVYSITIILPFPFHYT